MKSGTAAAPRWVLFNPRAGGGKAAQAWRRLQAAEGNRLEGLEVLSGSTAEGAAAALDRRLGESAAALPEGRPRLLVVGGDGTFHLAANRVLEAGLGDRVELALIPAGTGSDLARGLGLPRAPAAALDLALRGGAHPLDALEVRLTAGPAAPGRAFSVNVTSAGLSGEVVESLAGGEHAGRPRGAASYVVESLRAVAGYRPTPLRVRVDGEPVHDGPLFLVAAANGRFFGAGMKIAPAARPDDGFFEVVLVRPFPRWQLPWRLVQLFLGTHARARPVTLFSGRRLELEAAGDLPPLDLDGDPYRATAAEVRVLPGALKMIRPSA